LASRSAPLDPVGLRPQTAGRFTATADAGAIHICHDDAMETSSGTGLRRSLRALDQVQASLEDRPGAGAWSTELLRALMTALALALGLTLFAEADGSDEAGPP